MDTSTLIIKPPKRRDPIARELFENPFNKPRTHEPKHKKRKRLTQREIERAFEDG